MASSGSAASLQSWLNQATDPDNQEDRWDCIQGFYQLVNQEPDGPQVSLRLLAHKIQSPQEKEALQALTVLEACMNNCGKRFHAEAAKFRFLNELIKIITPKYFGAWSPQKVKDRVTEVLYGWTLWLKDEPKIQEAYSMLKKQGIVVTDPKLPDTVAMPPLPQRASESVFDQEDKALLLSRLLKSTRPEDLETANRLIKNTVREEQEKAEKESKRESTLKEVQSSTKELRELLDQHTIPGSSSQLSDNVKTVYERCERLRPGLFRLASETVDDDAALAQVLAANDELTLAVGAYKELVGKADGSLRRGRSDSEAASSRSITPTSPRGIKSYHLIDLSALDSPPTRRNADSPPALRSSSPLFFSHAENGFQSGAGPGFSESESLPTQTPQSYFDELMQLEEDAPMKAEQSGERGVLLRSRGCGGGSAALNGTDTRSPPENLPFPRLPSQKDANGVSSEKPDQSSCSPQLLKNVFVPMETIQSSQLEPITLYDRGGIRVSLHFARHSPPAHPGVAVVVMSAVNTSALHVKDFNFQAAVPKSMLVKLQPASATQLPPYNPLLPPAAVSQVLLLANPHRSAVRLRYKLTLTHGGQQLVETGDVGSFPDWSALIGH